MPIFSFFLKIIYIFREREREGERRERDINKLPFAGPSRGAWPITQACALIGNQTGHLSFGRSALNPLSHTSQG